VEPSRKSQKKKVHANSLCVAPLKAPMSLLVKAEVEAQHAILLCVAVDGIHQDNDADDVVAAKFARPKSRAPFAWKTLSCSTERGRRQRWKRTVLEPLELFLGLLTAARVGLEESRR
jgi:hypothetical protein